MTDWWKSYANVALMLGVAFDHWAGGLAVGFGSVMLMAAEDYAAKRKEEKSEASK